MNAFNDLSDILLKHIEDAEMTLHWIEFDDGSWGLMPLDDAFPTSGFNPSHLFFTNQ